MAIFVSDNKQFDGVSSGSSGATIIAQGTKIKGEINTECRVHIDGEFEGTILSKDSVMVGKSGLLKGEIQSVSVSVSGNLIGNVNANLVEIKPHGRIEGTVSTQEFVIERKGIFMGESKRKNEVSRVDASNLELKKIDKKDK